MIQFILMDIEGTTTSISFVHEVLFPYASANLMAFVQRKQDLPAVQAELRAVQATVLEEQGNTISLEEAVRQLLQWIEEDRKHTALKNLQGYLWKEGYETAEYQGHIYEDVLPVMLEWRSAGIQLGIYSSGSVEAQKLLFRHSICGDLTPHLSAHFDTRIGHKKDQQSYKNIQIELGVPANEILFLSDVEAELDAALASGMQTIQLVRPGTVACKRHPVVAKFDEIEVKIMSS